MLKILFLEIVFLENRYTLLKNHSKGTCIKYTQRGNKLNFFSMNEAGGQEKDFAHPT